MLSYFHSLRDLYEHLGLLSSKEHLHSAGHWPSARAQPSADRLQHLFGSSRLGNG